MSERLGKYIVIEGTDATGKSTVADILADKMRATGREVIRVDEPDSAKDVNGRILAPMSSELRRIIKDGSLSRSALTNVLLFTAQRRENWLVDKEALASGIDVISARNWWSTDAFQGYAEGVNHMLINLTTRVFVGKDYMKPDYGFILDLADENERMRRLNQRGALDKPDTFESRGDDFQAKIRMGYHAISKSKNIPIISALPPKEEVAETIWQNIQK